MRIVATHPGCRVQDVADGLGISVGGASKSADRLERSGWVSRVDNPSDRRSSMLELTAAGKRMVAAGSAIVREEMDPRVARFSGRGSSHTLPPTSTDYSGYARTDSVTRTRSELILTDPQDLTISLGADLSVVFGRLPLQHWLDNRPLLYIDSAALSDLDNRQCQWPVAGGSGRNLMIGRVSIHLSRRRIGYRRSSWCWMVWRN
ncbi:MarR family winged helix-turn-helix transcriptional regulator, partial [Nocardia sp. NPDC052278]|uniref:MarR family winged helix-turn-helix transcriptional regulator n=1 Tax=unclassified Nocardia TaxID=2637762 RepID=UPI0036BF704C